MPDPAAHGGDGIAEGTVRLGVPGSGRGNQRCFGGEVVRPESNQREQAKQRRGGAHDREVGPLPLGFDAQMGTSFLKGDFHLPARDEPLEDIDGGGVEIGAEEGLRWEFTARIAHQQPANGHWGQAATVPNGGTGGDLNDTIGAAVPESDGVALPNRAGIVQHLRQGGQAPAPRLRRGRLLTAGRPRPGRLGGAGA